MRPIEVRFEKNINNLTLVREADSRRQWEYVAVTLLGAVFVFGLLFYGWQRYQYLQYSYSITDAQRYHNQLIEKRNELNLQREDLRRGDRIEWIAKRMGMVQPVPGQIEVVRPTGLGNSQPQLSAKK